MVDIAASVGRLARAGRAVTSTRPRSSTPIRSSAAGGYSSSIRRKPRTESRAATGPIVPRCSKTSRGSARGPAPRTPGRPPGRLRTCQPAEEPVQRRHDALHVPQGLEGPACPDSPAGAKHSVDAEASGELPRTMSRVRGAPRLTAPSQSRIVSVHRSAAPEPAAHFFSPSHVRERESGHTDPARRQSAGTAGLRVSGGETEDDALAERRRSGQRPARRCSTCRGSFQRERGTASRAPAPAAPGCRQFPRSHPRPRRRACRRPAPSRPHRSTGPRRRRLALTR